MVLVVYFKWFSCLILTMVICGDKMIKLLSWNVNGLGDKIKRTVVLQYIKQNALALTWCYSRKLTWQVTHVELWTDGAIN